MAPICHEIHIHTHRFLQKIDLEPPVHLTCTSWGVWEEAREKATQAQGNMQIILREVCTAEVLIGDFLVVKQHRCFVKFRENYIFFLLVGFLLYYYLLFHNKYKSIINKTVIWNVACTAVYNVALGQIWPEVYFASVQFEAQDLWSAWCLGLCLVKQEVKAWVLSGRVPRIKLLPNL